MRYAFTRASVRRAGYTLDGRKRRRPTENFLAGDFQYLRRVLSPSGLLSQRASYSGLDSVRSIPAARNQHHDRCRIRLNWFHLLLPVQLGLLLTFVGRIVYLVWNLDCQ